MRTPFHILRYVAIALLLGFAVLGLRGVVQQWPHVVSVGQQVQTWAQVVFGILGLVAALQLSLSRPVRRPVQWLWTTAFALAGGTAPVVWAGAPVLAGVAAAAVSALVGVAVWWLALHPGHGPRAFDDTERAESWRRPHTSQTHGSPPSPPEPV